MSVVDQAQTFDASHHADCRSWLNASTTPFLTGGGLASYQSDFPAIFKRAATLVDKILKGAKPADIPFEQLSNDGVAGVPS